MVNFQIVLSVIALFVVGSHSFNITGLVAGTSANGQRPMRLEISKFATSGPAFDLYIQALQRMHATAEAEQTGWFQIAGIHGYPVKPWNGAGGNPSWGSGYCTHGSTLFPTWHRPYVALFEQILWTSVQTIAASYPASNNAAYVAAAQTFRVPYWDWAANPHLPGVATTKQITINTPSGQQTIVNPLFQYTFKSLPNGPNFPAGDIFSTYKKTVRWPDAQNNSQNAVANQTLTQNADYMKNTIYQILTSTTNYTQFASTASPGMSLESVHNAVHYFVGGTGGHMNYLSWSGFDPMFMLHHANVDRMFALWQALYPNLWVTPMVDGGTYGIKPGTMDTSSSVLPPFNDCEAKFYTPDSSRYTLYFGYTYPELLDWQVDAATLTKNVKICVNELYGPPTGQGYYKKRTGAAATQVSTQWVASLQVDPQDVPSYNIDLFFGPPAADPSTWALSGNIIGTFPVLSQSGGWGNGGFGGGAAMGTKYIQIPMSTPLKQHGSDLSVASVVPLLKQYLYVRAVGAGGVAVPLNELSNFSIVISSRTVTAPATTSEFPTYSPWIGHPEVTAKLN